MALFDFLTGGAKKRDQTKSGPGNAGGGNEVERKKRLAEIAAAKAKNSEVSGKLDADAAAKKKADEVAAKKKKAGDFWNKVLK
jgi:hypothetical protein